MGGSIFVGIREEDGTEHLFETWTNYWPQTTANPDFYEKGSTFSRIVLNNENKKLKQVQCIEYGYLLFDFKNKELLSCNSYYSPGVWGILQMDGEDAVQVLRVLNEGWAKDVFDARIDGAIAFTINPPPEYVRKSDPELVRAELATNALGALHGTYPPSFYVSIIYNPPGWTFTSLNIYQTKGKGIAKGKEFLARNGWNAKWRGKK